MKPLPDYREALTSVLGVVSPLNRTERVALSNCGGRVLREAIRANRDLPPFNRSQMDGYALRASEVGQLNEWPVFSEIPAGRSGDFEVPTGHCVAIATGAPLPADVDTVIQHELSDQGNPVHFSVDQIEPGNAVHRRGSDAREGDILLEPPVALTAHHLGIAASVGKADLSVAKRPRALVLSSGDEIVPIDAPTLPHQIHNSNGIQTSELLRRFGAEPMAITHVHDELDETIEKVREAIDHADLVITIGGISAGRRDHFPAAFEVCKVKYALQRAAIQPGKPVTVGRAPNGAMIVGLPGNPVSALACACLIAWPIVRLMLGLDPDPGWREVQLGHAVKPNPKRRLFRPAMLDNKGCAVIPDWAGSGDLSHTGPTSGLLELPLQDQSVEAGTTLRYLAWP